MTKQYTQNMFKKDDKLYPTIEPGKVSSTTYYFSSTDGSDREGLHNGLEAMGYNVDDSHEFYEAVITLPGLDNFPTRGREFAKLAQHHDCYYDGWECGSPLL
jgi:Regulator of ribonuclease activity B